MSFDIFHLTPALPFVHCSVHVAVFNTIQSYNYSIGFVSYSFWVAIFLCMHKEIG